MPPSEHTVTCHTPLANREGDEQLRFEIDGEAKSVSLRISQISRHLISELPDVAIDLIELAAFVYAIDASVSRGGLVDQGMGAKWHRSFKVDMPVRMQSLWSDSEIKGALEETLMFLSGDRFEFTFTPIKPSQTGSSGFFDFGPESSWRPDTVLMFSGGLDSYAGALEEIIDRRRKVALVSHFSATKIAPVQRSLQKGLADKLGSLSLKHIPMQVQLGKGTNSEGTHRARSFLFAALGMATAVAFGKDRVSFYENGVVSLNLPPVGNVLGTRATRTTHPQTLQRFQDLFSRIFDAQLRVDNPFFWRTKTEVVQTIARLGMADQIAFTRSCADVHNQTKQFAHCGRCSQCVDRRFAMLAAGLEAYDPAEAYRVDLMSGPRDRVQDKEVALSYVRNAQLYETMSGADLMTHFPAALNAVNHLGEPPETALNRIAALLQRHGQSVTTVIRTELLAGRREPAPKNSLPNLYGELQRQRTQSISSVDPTTLETARLDEVIELAFDRERKLVTIDDGIAIKGATYRLLSSLADDHLSGAGQGLDPLDYPMANAGALADKLGLQDEAALRQSVRRSREKLKRELLSAGRDAADGEAIIENIPWHGYRLNPERVKVRLVSAK